MKPPFLICSLLIASLALTSARTSFAVEPLYASWVERSLSHSQDYADRELLIQFKPDTTEAQKLAILDKLGAQIIEEVSPSGGGYAPVLRIQIKGLSVQEAVRLLALVPVFEIFEPNWRIRGQQTNDPLLAEQWALGQVRLDATRTASASIAALQSLGSNQKMPSCHSVALGLIDTALETTHPDLAENLWKNPQEALKDGVDSDSNGYVDDRFGWNFVKDSNQVGQPGKQEHATLVAGVAAAVGENGQGISGVCNRAKIIPAVVLGAENHGLLSDAIKAVDYLSGLKQKGLANVAVVNNSWSFQGYSIALRQALSRAQRAEILHVFAAGNSVSPSSGNNLDKSPSFFAFESLPNVLSVAALKRNGTLADFSNYGLRSVELAAPGVDVLTTSLGGRYKTASGTSIASAFVSGAAALVSSKNPKASAWQIRQLLLNQGKLNDALVGKTAWARQLDLSGLSGPIASLPEKDTVAENVCLGILCKK